MDGYGDKGGCQAGLAVFITDSAFQNALVHGIVDVGHQADNRALWRSYEYSFDVDRRL